MLSGDGNENSQKAVASLISEKTTLHVQHTFFLYGSNVVCGPVAPAHSYLGDR